MLHIAHQQAHGGIDARIQRHHHARHAELGGDRRRMQRPGAAESEQLEIAQIMAAHGGDGLDRLLHLHIDDAYDPFGSINHIQLQFIGNLRLDCAMSGRRIEPHLAAEEIALAQIAENQVAVCEGRLTSASSVTSGPGHGAGTLRSYLQHAETVHAGDGAAACAHRVDVNHGQRDVALLNLAAILRRGLAVLDQGHVAGGPAHVESDEVEETRRAASLHASRNAACRTGEHGRHRFLRSDGEGRHAAIRLHDIFLRRGQAGARQTALRDCGCSARGWARDRR